jgi:hypothetical protein
LLSARRPAGSTVTGDCAGVALTRVAIGAILSEK